MVNDMAGIQVPITFKLGVEGNVSGAISNAKSNLMQSQSLSNQSPVAGAGEAAKNTSKMSSGIGQMTGALMKMAGFAFTLLAILQSSKMLIRVMEQVGKLINILLRPIGDTLATIIAPVIMLLKPFAIMMNALMRPFLQDARKIFRMGQQARAAGDTETSNALMMKGATVLGLGFVNLLTVAIGEGMKFMVDIVTSLTNMLIEGFQLLGSVLLGVIGASEETQTAWTNLMDGLQGTVTQTGEVMKAFISVGVAGISESITNLKNQLVEDAKNLSAGIVPVQLSFADLEGQLGAEGSTTASVKKFYDELEILKKKTEDNITNLGLFGTSLQKDVFAIFKSGIDDAVSDAAKFKEIFSNLFPSFGGMPEGVQQTAASGLAASGPFDEIFSLFDSTLKGDIDGIFSSMTDLINPLHNLFEWFGFLQDATKLLHGEGGAGFKELQVEVAKNITSMESFGNTTSKAIGAIDSAVGSAKYFMNQSQFYANQAAASASKAASAANSVSKISSPKKVNDLIITSDGRTFETSPDDNIFATKGKGVGGTTINLNIGTIQALDGNDMKRKLDELIRDNLRKYA